MVTKEEIRLAGLAGASLNQMEAGYRIPNLGPKSKGGQFFVALLST